MNKVSILIPLYNAEQYIEETIRSVLAQTYENIEIIIVDDASTDNSYEMAKKFESSNIIVTQQKNQGPGAARNKAFELSSGDYIQYLDADDLLELHKIKIQLEVLKKYGDGTFVFGRVGEFCQTLNNVSFQTAKYHKSYTDNIDFLSDYWGYGGMIQIASCLIPRTTIVKAGKWNEQWILNEDGEFLSRVIFNSKQIIYLQNSISYYRKDNIHSLNSQRTRKHYESQLASYESYELMSKDYYLNPNIQVSLAKCYSRIYHYMYPNFDDLRLICEERVKSLGFTNLFPIGRKAYIVIAYIIGVKKALRFKEYIKNQLSYK